MKLTYSNKEIAGEYSTTAIDDKKDISNRLVSICGTYRTVIMADGEMVELKGKRAWDSWSKSNEYVCDF